MSSAAYDAVVVGAGPNGLAAAITLAQSGRSVLVLEAEATPGGGTRTAELSLPGYLHDICSTIQPLGVSSPFFKSLDLEQHGLEWIYPPAALAHPFDDGSVALLERSFDATAATLGADGAAWERLFRPFVEQSARLNSSLLAPVWPPRHPLLLARFGLPAIRSARGLASARFKGQYARGLFAGMAAHSMVPLEQLATASFGLVLGVSAHAVGWPVAKGGSQRIVDALVRQLRALGGEIECGRRVASLAELPRAKAVLCDVTPRQLLEIAGDQLTRGYRRTLGHYRYGPGAFKLDWALDGPIPWTNPTCLRAATVHLGPTLQEIAGAEREVSRGGHPERPFVLLAQQSLFDASRAPAGRQTAWAYTHVPNGSTLDMTARIEAQIERFAPGFRERILARSVMTPADLEAYNANYIGGDINGGLQDLRQLFTRPVPRLDPYYTGTPGLYLCSSSTPPGGGVHGMCGYWAARSALRRDS
jgi:phytoene dehydrogenase-like protein